VRTTEGEPSGTVPSGPHHEVAARLRERITYVAAPDELAQVAALLTAISPLVLKDPLLTTPATVYEVLP